MGLVKSSTPRFDRIAGVVKNFCRGLVGSDFDGHTVAVLTGVSTTVDGAVDSITLDIDSTDTSLKIPVDRHMQIVMGVKIQAALKSGEADGFSKKYGAWTGHIIIENADGSPIISVLTAGSGNWANLTTPVFSVSGDELLLTCGHTGVAGYTYVMDWQAALSFITLKNVVSGC